MRFMLLLKGDPGNPEDQRSGVGNQPNEELVAAMMGFFEELTEAGVFVSAEGLLPSSVNSARVLHKRMSRTIVDGPFAEAKELVAGYYIIEVPSLADAVEWASKVPVQAALTSDEDEAVVEVRQIAGLDDVEGISDELREQERALREKLAGA
jgi:hypothetical protein